MQLFVVSTVSTTVIGLSQHSASLTESRGTPSRYSPKSVSLSLIPFVPNSRENASERPHTSVSVQKPRIRTGLPKIKLWLHYHFSPSQRRLVVVLSPSELSLTLKTKPLCSLSKNSSRANMAANIWLAMPVLSTSPKFLNIPLYYFSHC